MRARPREINIFNMSLLDILCGALGAFCFMMLVALPYYTTGSDAERKQNREATANLLRDAERLRERMSDPAQAEELRKLIDNLTAQIKQLEGEVNQYAYENQQLKKQADDLTAKNDKQRQLIEQKKPFLVLTSADDLDQEVDLYVEDDLVSERTGKSANPPFDPDRKWHNSGWKDDITGVRLPDRGFAAWVGATTAPGTSYRVFAKEGNDPGKRRPTNVSSVLFGDMTESRLIPLADLTLGPQRFWDLIGTVQADENGKLSFVEATQAQRDDEWRKRNMRPPPPPTAAPTATPAPSIDMEDLERRRKEIQERVRREYEQKAGSPTQAPSATNAGTPISEEEMRGLRERIRKMRDARSPSPAASATP